MKVKWKWIAVGIVTAVNAAVLGLPAAVAVASGQLDRLDFYLKALQYGLKGLQAYFGFIVDLFKAAVGL